MILEPGVQDVWLWQGPDRAREAELREAVNTAIADSANAAPKTLDDTSDPLKDAANAYDAFVTEAKTRAVHCVLKPLGHKAWRALVAEHPPREDDEADRVVGANSETFFDALLSYWDDDKTPVVKTLVKPVFKSQVKLVEVLDGLAFGEFRDLSQAAYVANTGGSPDPKPGLSSRLGLTGNAT